VNQREQVAAATLVHRSRIFLAAAAAAVVVVVLRTSIHFIIKSIKGHQIT
jgi:hypothetical protein